MNLRFLITYLFVIPISVIAAAQSEIPCDDPVTICYAVNNSNLHTLYIGVGNRISIKAQGVSPENIIVKLSSGGGRLLSAEGLRIEGKNGFYTAWVCFVGEVLLAVYSKENGAEKKLVEKTLQTRVIPSPKSEGFKEVINSLGLKVDSTLLSR